ncbi:MAG: carbohydrate binding domain-containing protein [Flavobacteriaceae bacterium]|jgi:hypothetical protein|nr:carbohydrate binding domain-containing protein [Flavobacteriaceae bacterium]
MKKSLLPIALFFLNFTSAQVQNSGFENSANNDSNDWYVKKTENYEGIIDTETGYQGKQSMRLTGKQDDLKTFMPFSQGVPLNLNKIQKIEISAYIKSENIRGDIGLWTQVRDAKNEKIGFGNSTSQNRKVAVNKDWTKYSLEFVVDENAKKLIVGGLLSGSGTVWFDDFEIKEIPFSEKPTSEIAWNYIQQFRNIIQKNSLFSDKIEWNSFDEDLSKISKGMETIDDTKLALDYMIKKLRNVGDNHSFIVSKERVAERKVRNSTGIEPEYQLIDQSIGYVKVPGFSSSNTEIANEFAQKIHDFIKELDSQNTIKGWIVDLRNNTGGTIYPMILGLGSLIGDGTLGYFVTKDRKTPWVMENGKYGRNEIFNPYKIKNFDSKIAVLIGPKTVSAGEATTIAFIGKSNVKLFGQPSSGKTSANQLFALSDGKELALAVSYEMDRTGKEYRETINPDIFVNDFQESDETLETAKKWIFE